MTTGSVSPRRADTRRNHDRILAVAAESLRTPGGISFNAIAKQAEVGVGTVYRHFPTPEALILAVYQLEVRHLVEVVPSLLEAYPPEQAFRTWTTDHLARYMMTKRGLASALQAASTASGELPATAYAAHLGRAELLIRVDGSALVVTRGHGPVDLAFATGPEIRRLISGELAPDRAIATGVVEVLRGRRALLDRFATTFHVAA